MPHISEDKSALSSLVSGQDMPEVARNVLSFLDAASLSQYAKIAKSASEVAKKQWVRNLKEHLISYDSVSKDELPYMPAVPQGKEKEFYASIHQKYIKTAESLLQNKTILSKKFKDERGHRPDHTILVAIRYAGLNQLFTQLLTKVIHEYQATKELKAELDSALFKDDGDPEPSLLAMAANMNSISIFHLLSEAQLERAANNDRIFNEAKSVELLSLLLKYHKNRVALMRDSYYLKSVIEKRNLKLLQNVLDPFSPEERSYILMAEGSVSFLHHAAKTGDKDIFKKILMSIPKEERLNQLLRLTSGGESLLHAAAEKGDETFVNGVTSLMAQAQARFKGDGKVETYCKNFVSQLNSVGLSPIDIAGREGNAQALSYFMGLLSEEEQQQFTCDREHSLLKIAASYNATDCIKYLWEHVVSKLNDWQKYRIATLCLEANTKDLRTEGCYIKGEEVMDFILSQFPDPAVKERLLHDSKALFNSLTKNNGLFSKTIQSYPNKDRLKERLKAYLTVGFIEDNDVQAELARALVTSNHSDKYLEEVFKLFEPHEVTGLITSPRPPLLLMLCLERGPHGYFDPDRRKAFSYLLSKLSLQERAQVLTDVILDEDPDFYLLLALPKFIDNMDQKTLALFPNYEQIDSLDLSDWAKDVLRRFYKDLEIWLPRPQEAGPQP
ncbi:MAG: hypothetical protein K0R66_271 [Gammaproteobacteria bacterium]|jgi:hypothetical protein|nr:hypothetical protein [Gammaproteobacteria bacterium]